MRRICWSLTFYAALVCGMAVMASASCLIVNVDVTAHNTPVTLTAQNVDINDVLSALFNASDDTYQLQTGLGIIGKIDALQFTRKPFDDAVKAILAKVDATFTCTKKEGGIYLITASANADASVPVPTLYVPTVNDPDMIVSGKLTLPIIKDKNAAKNASPPGKGPGKNKPGASDASGADGLLGDGDTPPTGDTTGKDDKATTEECYLAMIKIRNQPVHVFAVGFGADELPDFSILANPGGTTSTGTTGTGYNGTTSGYGTTSANGTTNAYGTSYGSSYPYSSSTYPYGTTTSSSGTVTINGVTYTPNTTTSTTTTSTTGGR